MKKTCPRLALPCDDNVGCYTLNDLCDGKAVCLDGTDELSSACPGVGPPTRTVPLPTNSVACSTEATCLNDEGVKICLTDDDMCNGVQQCREGFDEQSCPSPPGNPYILPTLVSLAAVVVILLVMCILYKLCVYRYSSARVNNDQATSCSTIFLKKQTGSDPRLSETRLDIGELEPSDKSSEARSREECSVAMVTRGSREQCVQYPSEEENTGDESTTSSRYHDNSEEESVSSSSNWVSTTI